METYNELLSLLKNLNYYNDEIHKLIHRQIDIDLKKNHERNSEAITKRINALGECMSNKEWIESYTLRTLLQVQHANSYDKRINIFDEEVTDEQAEQAKLT